MRTTSFHVLILMIFFAVSLTAAEVKDSSFNNDLPPGQDSHADYSQLFSARLASSRLDQPELFRKAVSLLTEMQTGPSCTRVATSALLTSCETLDGSLKGSTGPENPEAFLENVKSIYAARLAVCELVGAGVPVPRECSAMVPSGQQKGKLRRLLSHGGQKTSNNEAANFEAVDQTQLARCLRSLESRPQWWTSYSNGRQNAFIMCKAARTDVEKEEILALHKSVTKVMGATSSELSEILLQAGRQSENQRIFVATVHRFQTQLQKDLEATKSEFDGFLASLATKFESVMQAVIDKSIGKLQVGVKGVEVELGQLSKGLHAAEDKVRDFQDNLGEAFQEAVSGSSQFTASLEGSREAVQDFQNTFQQLSGTAMEQLLSHFKAVRRERQNSDEWMVVHNTLLKEVMANTMYSIELTDKREEKTRILFDHMFGNFSQVTKSFGLLASAVNELTSKVERVNRLLDILNQVWIVLVWGGGLQISLLVWFKLGGRLGMLIICFIVLACLVMTFGLPEGSADTMSQLSVMGLTAHIQPVPFLPPFGQAALGICVALAITFVVLLRRFVARRQTRARVLPVVQLTEENSPKKTVDAELPL